MPSLFTTEQLTAVGPKTGEAGSTGAKAEIEVEQGVYFFSRWIAVEGGTQTTLKDSFTKTTTTHDWALLFSLYDVPLGASLDDWVKKYKSHPDKTLLDRMFPYVTERAFEPSCEARIHPKGTDKKKVRLGFRVLRLKMHGITKDAILFNSANLVARDDKDNPYSDVTSSCA